MKTVAILCDLCHASPRIPGLVKYIGQHGWRPVVIGPPLPEGHERSFGPNRDFPLHSDAYYPLGAGVRCGRPGEGSRLRSLVESNRVLFNIAKFMHTRYKEIVSYPDDHASWASEVSTEAIDIVRQISADVILSSSSPVSMHVLADRISRATGVPWVADFRDLWTQNYEYPFSHIRRHFERRLEIDTITSASAYVSVSSKCCERLTNTHPPRPTEAILNGFDPVLIMPTQCQNRSNTFNICYTGHIYPDKQNPLILLESLALLMKHDVLTPNTIHVNFYGPVYKFLHREIDRRQLTQIVHQHGVIAREEALRVQRTAHVVVLFHWESAEDLGVIPLKTFEYFAARRPILATGGKVPDTLEALLNETGAGVTCRTAAQTAAYLEKAYHQFIETGGVAYSGIPELVAEYSYPRMAEKFAAVLDRACMGDA